MLSLTKTLSIALNRLREAPSKPPRRAYFCTVLARTSDRSRGWLLLPASLDYPLTTAMPVRSINLRQDDPSIAYLKSDHVPEFAAFRMPEDGQIRIEDWEFSTSRGSKQGEVWLAGEVKLAPDLTFSDLAASQLKLPAYRPPGAAILARWEAPRGTVAAAIAPLRTTFSIVANAG
jgi:hypothetical protein